MIQCGLCLNVLFSLSHCCNAVLACGCIYNKGRDVALPWRYFQMCVRMPISFKRRHWSMLAMFCLVRASEQAEQCYGGCRLESCHLKTEKFSIYSFPSTPSNYQVSLYTWSTKISKTKHIIHWRCASIN